MAIKKPAAWLSTSAYSVGDKVSYKEIGFECIVAVAADPDGNTDPIDNTSWKSYAVFNVDNFYALQESVQQGLKNEDAFIENSIPLFIQNAEVQLSKIIRSPAQIITRSFQLDTDSKFAIPSDLLVIKHLRIDTDTVSGYELRANGSIQISSADRTAFESLRQEYVGGRSGRTYGNEYPLYRTDDEYFYIAPDFDSDMKVELTYVQDVPTLGSTVGLVNDDYEPINADGQDLEQWIAADPDNNNSGNFIAADTEVIQNLWTATLPHVLKAGALSEGFAYLNDDVQSQLWEGRFRNLLKESASAFEEFQTDRVQEVFQDTSY